MAKKKKLKAIGKVKEQAATLLQRLVRLKASDDYGYCSCVSCGTTKHFKEMQGGHYMPRGESSTLLMEENIHPQCFGCNAFGMKYGIAAYQYDQYMIDMYGRAFVKALLMLKGRTWKWVRADLEDQIKDFKARIKVEEERIGI